MVGGGAEEEALEVLENGQMGERAAEILGAPEDGAGVAAG